MEQQKSTILSGIGFAFATILYICLIASFFSFAPFIFGNDEPKTMIIPVVMLTLLVLSAAITGSLVFARPAQLYLKGDFQSALTHLISTIVSLFGFIILIVSFLFLTR